jgi:polysaccharide export outer membrane protein
MWKLSRFIAPLAVALAALAAGESMAQTQRAPAARPAAAAATPPVKPSAQTESPAEEYVLGPEDVVEIEVVGTADKARARVYTDGTIQTSMGGRISAAGRTPKELAADVAKALKAGGFYADPVVNVEVVGYASRYVTVLGNVGSPGLVPINRAYRLSEVLARVGGLRSDGADYVIVTGTDGKEKRYNVQKMSSGDASQDPFVNPGEKIFSPEADVFYISGQVKSPGSYPMRSGMTVAQAIAKGGGLTESGSDKKVTVRRGGQKIKLQADAAIEPGDVLSVGERLF